MISYVNKVVHVWRVDLLILRSNQHASHTNQLVVLTFYEALGTEPVDQINTDK